MTTWNDIQQEMATRAQVPLPCAAESFWSDFQARARLTVQETPGQTPRRILWASLAFAGSLAVLAITAIPFFWAPDSMAGAIQVLSLEVDSPHSGAMILNVGSNNGKDTGAIVWVSGLEESHENAP